MLLGHDDVPTDAEDLPLEEAVELDGGLADVGLVEDLPLEEAAEHGVGLADVGDLTVGAVHGVPLQVVSPIRINLRNIQQHVSPAR